MFVKPLNTALNMNHLSREKALGKPKNVKHSLTALNMYRQNQERDSTVSVYGYL